MKLTVSGTVLVSLLATSHAFSSIKPLTKLSSSSLSMAEDNMSVEALRAAAAKAREEAERLRKELGQETSTAASAAQATVAPAKTPEQVQSLLPSLLAESDLDQQAAQWTELKESNSLQKFGSANLRSFPVPLSMLEQRTGLTPASLGLDDSNVDLDDFKFATLYVTGGCTLVGVLSLAVLPPNIGATVCYLVALIPVLFLAIGSTAPEIIANAIASAKGEGSRNAATAQERIVRHEAAHFCCGYWCGLPIAGYSTDEGVARVEFAVASPAYSTTEVAALAVTGLAGLVGEAAQFDGVQPGSASGDLMQLDLVFRRSADFVGAQAQQDLTRWGALTASLLLRQNAAQYEKVVQAFSRQASLEECIQLLEEK